MSTKTTSYEQDFYTWTQEQAAFLRKGAVQELDLPNLAEEVESLGISQKHALASHLRNLMMHLLKWHYQPSGRQMGHSWQSSIINARDEIATILEDLPSLQQQGEGLVTRRYPAARRLAQSETGLPLATFPETCPWSKSEVLDPHFWPGDARDTTVLP